MDDPDFLPMLVLDAILTGAKGVNVWSSFRTPPPQRRSRLYRALVDTGRASAVGGSLIPTQHPFLYTISITVTDGVPIAEVEREALEAIDRLRADGISAEELARARRQLAARFVFENDSVTNIAHQIGFFQTVSTLDTYQTMAARLSSVTKDQVEAAARGRLAPGCRTVGWFKPAPIDGAAVGARA